MSFELVREKIGENAYFSSVIDKKFKTNRISANFILPLDKMSAAVRAIAPFILRKGYSGCPDFTMLNKRLAELYGASFGGDVIKIGDYQVLNIPISFIDDRYALENESLIEDCTNLLAGILFSPKITDGKFDETDIKLEKQFLIDCIDSEINDKRTYAVHRLEQLMFSNEPFGINRYGERNEALIIDAKTAATEYINILKTSRLEIIFTGSSQPSKSIQVFKKAMESLNRNSSLEINNNVSYDIGEVREITEKIDVSQAKFVLGFRTGIKANDSDISAMRLMTAIYGGTPHSKLFINVREKLSLCYYCRASYDRFKGFLMVDCGIEDKNKDLAFENIIKQLELIKSGDFDEDELNSAKMSLVNSFKNVTNSQSGVSNWYLSQILSNTTNSPEAEAEKINMVTREEIIAVAQKIKLDTIYFLTGEVKSVE